MGHSHAAGRPYRAVSVHLAARCGIVAFGMCVWSVQDSAADVHFIAVPWVNIIHVQGSDVLDYSTKI